MLNDLFGFPGTELDRGGYLQNTDALKEPKYTRQQEEHLGCQQGRWADIREAHSLNRRD